MNPTIAATFVALIVAFFSLVALARLIIAAADGPPMPPALLVFGLVLCALCVLFAALGLWHLWGGLVELMRAARP